jgi:undecaprenyl-diphosphatase
MYKKIAAFCIGGFFFLSFVVYSYLVNKDTFTQLDFDTTVRFQNNIPRRLDPIFSFFSEIGSFEVSLIVLVVIIGFLVWKKRYIVAGAIFFLFGVFHLLEIFGKRFVDHFPPPQFMIRTEDQLAFPQFHVREVNSYPSGHSGRAAFLTGIIIFLVLYSKKLAVWQKVLIIGALLMYQVIMFGSRVYLGEHWTTDVVGGAILGYAFVFLAAVVL